MKRTINSLFGQGSAILVSIAILFSVFSCQEDVSPSANKKTTTVNNIEPEDDHDEPRR